MTLLIQDTEYASKEIYINILREVQE